MKQVLFICGQNVLRSPTAEEIFSSHPGIEVASAGINHAAEVPLSAELLEWADLIFVMESNHRTKISKKFWPHLKNKQITCLDIPDKYASMDPTLIQLLRKKITPFLPRGATLGSRLLRKRALAYALLQHQLRKPAQAVRQQVPNTWHSRVDVRLR